MPSYKMTKISSNPNRIVESRQFVFEAKISVDFKIRKLTYFAFTERKTGLADQNCLSKPILF